MKVILTGSTGFIGREVLEQCLQNTRISSIIALSRRDFPPALTRNPKLKVLVIKDFLSYPPTVLQEIQGAEACIWTLGKARMPDNETNKRVSIDYTLAAARAFKESLSSQPETISNNNTEFRFIYLSGAAAERDQTKSLWFMQDYRRIRGQVENELISFTQENKETFEGYIIRPGMVLSKEMTVRSVVFGMGPSVRVDDLAKVMLNLALDGNERLQILENSDIAELSS